MAKIDIARALKDRTYFASLTEEEKAQVRSANPVGASHLKDEELENVSGGLEGGDRVAGTTTTTSGTCACSSSRLQPGEPACVCAC